MKKISLSLSLILLVFLALPAIAEANIEISGHYNFVFDQFIEEDGQDLYSMNGIPGAVFGVGGWKQSTSEEAPNQFESVLDLEMNAQLNNAISLDASFVSLHDEFLGSPIASEKTRGSQAQTVRDNEPLRLKELDLNAETGFGQVTITNSFNYDFNDRVLTTQFDNDGGALNPYGQGVLVQTDMFGVDTQGFLFQTSESSGSDIIVDEDDRLEQADKLVYGADFEKNLANGEVGVLAVYTHDRESSIEEGFKIGNDIGHLAVNTEYSLTNSIDLHGEFITAQYGSGVDEVMNFENTGWAADSIDLGDKEDTEVIEVGATADPIPGLEISGVYQDVGQDYTPVLGASQRNDSWLGAANFDADEDGTGYHKGYSLSATYMLPVMYRPILSLDFFDYENTRSALLDDDLDENTNEQEAKAGIEVDRGVWDVETSYRYKNKTGDSDLVYNDINLNFGYNLITSNRYNLGLNTDLNYYTGDDNDEDQNFSTEMRAMIGLDGDYNLNDSVDLTASYDFGYAREDNDLFDGSARQNLVKLGANYQITEHTSFDLLYKYDNYNVDRIAEADKIKESDNKKEDEHMWYDGAESWEDRNAHYDGYTTHQVRATFGVSF